MTISEHRRLRMSLATLGLLVAGAVCADQALAQTCGPPLPGQQDCVPITLTANVQVTKLHPAVRHVNVACSGPSQVKDYDTIRGASSKMPVVNRAYTGTVTAIMTVQRSHLRSPANRTLNVSCALWVHDSAGTLKPAVASAGQPVAITDSNWDIVATGSTVTWTQAVTFPNAAP